jgi:hypothetical protein
VGAKSTGRASRATASWLLLCLLLAAAAACEGAVDGEPGPPAATQPGEWTSLVEVDWTLEPGSEAFLCALHTVTEDTYISAFRADAPPGTHHTLLTVTQANGPDRVFPCDPGTLSDAMIFASGFGTDDLVFPKGVAIRVPAGKQILLNLHLFNATPQTLTGRSGTLIQTLSPDEVTAEAEVVFAGTSEFSLPPNAEHSATGSCVFEQEATLLSLWPHMHQYGRHMVVEHHGADGVSTLHDAPFSFYEQLNAQLEPLVVRAGERIDVTCNWDNTSDKTVLYGDTFDKEMCFAGLYRYPAFGNGLYCDMSTR